MTCEQAQTRIDTLVEGELEGWTSWGLRRHLRRCPECAGVLKQARRLNAYLRRRIAPPVSVETGVCFASACRACKRELWLCGTTLVAGEARNCRGPGCACE